MTARPWMPLYVADYLADTGHLTTVEHGAYLLLIMHYWQNGLLPNDDEKLSRICRLPARQWQSIRDTIAAFFGEGWQHKRIETEIAKADETISKRSAAGKAGASGRYGKRMRDAPESQLPRARASPSPLPSEEGSLRSPSENPEPVSPTSNVAPSQASGATRLELVSEEPEKPSLELPAILDRRQYPEAFEALWDEYRPFGNPNATKADAHRAWAKLSPKDRSDCFEGLALYASWLRAENRERAAANRSPVEVKHLATFINKRGWEPYLEAAA